MCVYFQSAVKWVIPPLGLRTKSNDVEWKRFIEALRAPLTASLCLKLYFSASLLHASTMSPPFCFYGGIIISLSHPLLFRSEQNNKFQDHADAAFPHLKLILWTRQKLCIEMHNKDCSIFLFFFKLFFKNKTLSILDAVVVVDLLWCCWNFSKAQQFCCHRLSYNLKKMF